MKPEQILTKKGTPTNKWKIWGCSDHKLIWPKIYNHCPYCGHSCEVFIKEIGHA